MRWVLVLLSLAACAHAHDVETVTVASSRGAPPRTAPPTGVVAAVDPCQLLREALARAKNVQPRLEDGTHAERVRELERALEDARAAMQGVESGCVDLAPAGPTSVPCACEPADPLCSCE